MLRSSLVAASLLAAALLVGCAGPATALRRDNARLDHELSDARAELRTERRKNQDLSTENLVLRDKLGASGADANGDLPKLPVEVVAPDPDPATASPPAPADGDSDLGGDARVVGTASDGSEIVYVGDAAHGTQATPSDDGDLGDSDADDLQYAPADTDPPAPPASHHAARKPHAKAAPAADHSSSAASAAYEAAVAKVKAHDHDGAIAALRTFLSDYPRDDLADNAQYWLGEVYYDEKDWARALVEFRAVVDGYPRGNKVPDALLKMGYCFVSLQQTEKARAAFDQVVQSYPGTQPALLATAKLKELS